MGPSRVQTRECHNQKNLGKRNVWEKKLGGAPGPFCEISEGPFSGRFWTALGLQSGPFREPPGPLQGSVEAPEGSLLSPPRVGLGLLHRRSVLDAFRNVWEPLQGRTGFLGPLTRLDGIVFVNIIAVRERSPRQSEFLQNGPRDLLDFSPHCDEFQGFF